MVIKVVNLNTDIKIGVSCYCRFIVNFLLCFFVWLWFAMFIMRYLLLSTTSFILFVRASELRGFLWNIPFLLAVCLYLALTSSFTPYDFFCCHIYFWVVTKFRQESLSLVNTTFSAIIGWFFIRHFSCHWCLLIFMSCTRNVCLFWF